jgi:hypothetical protein
MRAHPLLTKTLIAIASLSIAFVAVMGFAHTKAGRPLLLVIGPVFGMGSAHAHSGAGRCPLGFDVAQNSGDKDAARARFAALHQGEGTPGTRVALGFSLGRTTRAEVQRWAASHQLQCVTPRVGADLDCSDVPSSALPADHSGPTIKSLWFNFDGKDLLASVIGIRKEENPQPILGAFESMRDTTTQAVGAPTKILGEPTATSLTGLLSQVSVEYKFKGYYAVARAGNMGDGYVLTEEYRALN